MFRVDAGPIGHSDPVGSALGLGAAVLVASSLGPAVSQAGQVVGPTPASVFGGATVKHIERAV